MALITKITNIADVTAEYNEHILIGTIEERPNNDIVCLLLYKYTNNAIDETLFDININIIVSYYYDSKNYSYNIVCEDVDKLNDVYLELYDIAKKVCNDLIKPFVNKME